MKTLELIAFVSFVLVGVFIIAKMIEDWFRKRQITRTLASRGQNGDDQFRKLFSEGHSADIAVRVRKVLSDNLKMPLHGLTPSDRLNEELNAELPANPHLFWELEAEFGIRTDVEDLESHERTLGQLITFQDLVEYVERKLTESRSKAPSVEENEKSSRIYDFAVRSIPVLCVGGFLTAVAGIVVQKRSLMNLGGLIFLSGFVVWGLANGGEMLRSIIRGVRGTSFKEIAARPWPLILMTGLALFFLWVGGFLLWGILKNLLSPK